MDGYVHQVLRSTADTEYLNGPGLPRCNVNRDTGTGELQVRRWPVTEVLAIQISAARSFPRVWTPVPVGLWDIRHKLIFSGNYIAPTAPDGGWTIDVAPGWIGCSPSGRTPTGGFAGGGGRGSQRVQVSYFNGWPHTSLTEDAAAGADVLYVDDVTGWSGAAGFCYDGSATEQASVVSVAAAVPFMLPDGAGSVQAGPGAVTLSAPLQYPHQAGTLVSAFPAELIHAAVLSASVQALNAGVNAITIQTVNGEKLSSGGGAAALTKEYQGILNRYMRVM